MIGIDRDGPENGAMTGPFFNALLVPGVGTSTGRHRNGVKARVEQYVRADEGH